MTFKEFYQLNEWIYEHPDQVQEFVDAINQIKELISTGNYHDAEDLLEFKRRKLEAQLKYAERERVPEEVELIKGFLNQLDDINHKTVEIRNIGTKRY